MRVWWYINIQTDNVHVGSRTFRQRIELEKNVFGKKEKRRLVCTSRQQSELITFVWCIKVTNFLQCEDFSEEQRDFRLLLVTFVFLYFSPDAPQKFTIY